MKLVEMNFSPSDRQLRQFGLTAMVALPLLGWLWGGDGPLEVNPITVGITGAIGAVLATVGLLWPPAIKPVFVGLMLLTLPIGMVISEIAMAATFYGLFVPLGLFFWLIGRDVLELKFDRQATTYWQRKKRPTDDASYLRQW